MYTCKPNVEGIFWIKLFPFNITCANNKHTNKQQNKTKQSKTSKAKHKQKQKAKETKNTTDEKISIRFITLTRRNSFLSPF